MRVPKRKPGKYAFDKRDPYITQKRYDKLKKELEKLDKFSQKKAAEEVKSLAELGDFSENHAYQTAKRRLRGILGRIDEIKDILKEAQIIPQKVSGGIIQIGSTVILDDGEIEKEYRIVGAQETDPSKGLISHLSPLGEQIIGHKAGDEVTINLANRIKKYQIKKVK